MDRNSSILLVTDGSETWRMLLEILVERFEYRVLTARTDHEAMMLVEKAHVDLALVEDRRDVDGCGFLSRLRTSHPDILRVVVLSEASSRSRDAVARAAVYQFLRQPLDAEQASLVVKRGLETRELARRHRLLSREFKLADSSSMLEPHYPVMRPQSQRFEKLVYVSEPMAQVCEQARIAARTDLPILIQGETGTGKELLARAIHYNSTRRESPLLTQNCGGVSNDLLQSELFGHKRGAFTGAISDRLGLFRAADGGTVFLDEISEVSPAFQVSLLRFLQEGEIKPLGSDQVLRSDVRIIAASNRPLKTLVAAGTFRRDLFYRLKGFEFEIPPLRDRVDDIAALAEFFAAKHGEATKRKILGISANVLEKLAAYDWQGNIRELETEIRRLVVLTGDGEYITTQHLSPAILAAPARRAPTPGEYPVEGRTLKDRVESLERQLIQDTLVRYRWNQSKAADELGLSRVGLANKIKRYRLDRAPAS